MAKIYISLGSNIKPQEYLSLGLQNLTSIFGELVASSTYGSEAVGFNGRNFLNMVVCAETNLNVTDVIKALKKIELNNGRLPNAQKCEPRTLDLDLLLYDDLVMDLPIVLPREDITKYAFVLWPLAEIAPKQKHPLFEQSFDKMWSSFDHKNQRIWLATESIPK